MSRFGRLPIIVPEKVEFKIDGSSVSAKGEKGVLTREIPQGISVAMEDGSLKVATRGKSKQALAMQGTFRSHLVNMVLGVSQGWKRSLEIIGAGYRANVEGDKLVLNIGYSHPVEMIIPEGLKVSVEKSIVNVEGFDKELVGQFAANVRRKREPEPYKGSGIKYTDEVVRRKAGKQAAKAGA